MAMQTVNNGELMSVVRSKINSNFQNTELLENKIHVIGNVPSTTKYPSEKAVADYVSKIYFNSSIPTSKSGDLLLHQNATQSGGGTKGKLKFNSSGTLSEFIPDRAICDFRSSSTLNASTSIPLAGEILIESDTKKTKVGNGINKYSDLAYLVTAAATPETPETPTSGITYGGNNDSGYGIANQNGWMKYPNGMILQWGLTVRSSTNIASFDSLITLPVSFAQKRIYSHAVLEHETTSWKSEGLMVHPRSDGLSRLRFVVKEGLSASKEYELHWMAIGF